MIIDENLPDGGLCLFFLKQVSNYNVHFTCYGGYQGFIFSRYSRIVSLCRFFLLVASNRIQFGLQQWNFSQSFPRRGTNLCIYWPHYCHCGLCDVLEFDKWRHYKLNIFSRQFQKSQTYEYNGTVETYTSREGVQKGATIGTCE